MAIIGEITHTTTYRYAKPVRFGTHRAMFLPRRGVGQAVPLAGSWFGDPGDYQGMSINVSVNKIGEMLDPSEA